MMLLARYRKGGIVVGRHSLAVDVRTRHTGKVRGREGGEEREERKEEERKKGEGKTRFKRK